MNQAAAAGWLGGALPGSWGIQYYNSTVNMVQAAAIGWESQIQDLEA
jgi:hypothetical protein